MAEKPDNVGKPEITEAEAGPGHNQPKEVVWERWQKKRTFVRALEGTYGELQQGLMDQPRIYKSKDWAWKGGPQFFDKPIINPQRTDIAQSIETHISVIAPGGTGQRHGHMNSALFYILSGKGYDIHDGKRIVIFDWVGAYCPFNLVFKIGLFIIRHKVKIQLFT